MELSEDERQQFISANFFKEIRRKDIDVYFHDMHRGKELLTQIFSGGNISGWSRIDINNVIAYYIYLHPDFLDYLAFFYVLRKGMSFTFF